MGFLPKDYVGVHTRVENYHKDHKDKASILTEFTITWNIVSFRAVVVTNKWSFSWSSFGTADKEKAFEKLETVAVGRALAFAWYEIKSGIASSEEMQEFAKKDTNQADEVEKEWFNDVNLANFSAIKDNFTKATAVAEARKRYKVSKKFAWLIEDLYTN